MQETKRTKNRRILIILIIVLCALLCATLLASYRLSSRITNDLHENAYDALMNASESIRQNIDSAMQRDMALVRSFGELLQSEGYADPAARMSELCRLEELYHMYYVDADGVGISETGERFSIASLPVRETALSGEPSVSTGFVGETGQRHLLVQAPILDGGGVVGALYAEVVATRYYAEEAFVFLAGEGRASLFNRADGAFVIKSPQTELTYLKTDTIFEAVRISNADEAVYDEFMQKVSAGAKSILQMQYGSAVSYIAILPCRTNPELYVATIISRQALEVEADSIGRLISSMRAILITGLSGLIVMGSFLLYRIMKERQTQERRELELMYENRSKEELTAALVKAQEANVAKTQFLNNMSHDIRTPMNAIIGMATIASQSMDEPDKLRECLSVITSSSHHLLALINDILDVSKIESGNLTLVSEPFALPVAIDSVVSIISPLCVTREQDLTVKLIGIVHEYLLGDKTKLSQVLVNLLNNANKFTPAKGSVQLIVEETPCDLAKHAAYRISVIDNGIGIAEENLVSVFDPFVRSENAVVGKVEGSGLGLFIAKNIVEAMGGSLTLFSRLGVGTTFTVTLTLPIQEKPDLAGAYRELKDKRALVVSHARAGCENILRDLADVGMLVKLATSERLSVETLAAAHVQNGSCDMVIINWDAPSPDFVEAIRPIRQRLGAEVPIVVLAEGDWQRNEAAAHNTGADAYIPKPVFQSRLYEKLAEIQRNRAIHERSPQTLMGRRMLLTEDNIVNQAVAKKLLVGAGASVEVANNGRESVDMFLTSPRGYYDAILMDIQMPVLNGYEAARMIRESAHPDAASVPIIALSAEVLTESVQRATEAGINAYLSKPIEPRNMINTLQRLTEK